MRTGEWLPVHDASAPLDGARAKIQP
jgi:hypothetical protein